MNKIYTFIVRRKSDAHFNFFLYLRLNFFGYNYTQKNATLMGKIIPKNNIGSTTLMGIIIPKNNNV